MKNRKLFSLKQPDLYVLLLALVVVSVIFSITSITYKNIDSLQQSNIGTGKSYFLKDKVQTLRSDVLIAETVQNRILLADDIKEQENADSSLHILITDLKELSAVVPPEFNNEFQQLSFFVNRKIKFINLVVNTYQKRGKEQGEALIGTGIGKGLTDSITKYADKLEFGFANQVTSSLEATKTRSERLQPVITSLAVISFIAILALSLLIIYRIRQKNSLIKNLEEGYEREMIAVKELSVARQTAEKSLQVKESFLANMSHEIRTPITGVIGFSDILGKSGLRPEQEKLLSYIRSSGSSLLSIVNDILDLSKLEAGMVRIESLPFRLRELVEEVTGILSPAAKEKEILLVTNINVDCEEYLLGDPVRLKQVLTNLVANAIKFTETGTITVSVDPATHTNNETRLQFTVTDTGIGMTEEQLYRIFHRFEQGESDTARKYGGTGLGLAITKNLVELQNGSIAVESKPGEGTRFTVDLSFQLSEKIPQHAGESASIQQFSEKYKVLIVDDNEVNRMLVEYMLSQWGLSYDSADSGREAIEKLNQQRFHLVLMDIQMPDLDGYATSKIIKKELQVPVVIIAMTAHVLPGEEEKCKAAGMDGYISKPLQETELNQIIAAHIPEDAEYAESFQFIDPGFMSHKFYGNHDFIQKILDQVRKQYPEELIILTEAWTARKGKEMALAAHKMASTVSILHQHSKPMTILREIEAAAKKRTVDWVKVDALFKELDELTASLMSEATRMEQLRYYTPSLS